MSGSDLHLETEVLGKEECDVTPQGSVQLPWTRGVRALIHTPLVQGLQQDYFQPRGVGG